MKVVRTRRGARLIQGGAVLSEILARPGATHSLFDLLAALIQILTPGPRVALLGFAGGGLVAPLRALGYEGPLRAVDLDHQALPLFRELSSTWAGDVTVEESDAAVWLCQQEPFDLILEDLSVEGPEGETKPEVSWRALPDILADRLAPGGIAVTNLLPVPELSWNSLQSRLSEPFDDRRLLELTEYENRVLVCGGSLPAARRLTRDVRLAMEAIGSRQARLFRTRSL